MIQSMIMLVIQEDQLVNQSRPETSILPRVKKRMMRIQVKNREEEEEGEEEQINNEQQRVESVQIQSHEIPSRINTWTDLDTSPVVSPLLPSHLVFLSDVHQVCLCSVSIRRFNSFLII